MIDGRLVTAGCRLGRVCRSTLPKARLDPLFLIRPKTEGCNVDPEGISDT